MGSATPASPSPKYRLRLGRLLPPLLSVIPAALQSPSTAVVVVPRQQSLVRALPPPTYLETVCKPPTLRWGDVVPPCVAVEVTEALCVPNGTAPLYLEAHAQCMCKGSYFAEWTACRACLSLHGLLADRDRSFYQSVADVASASLCAFLTVPGAPAPTTTFKALFSSADAAMPGTARPPTSDMPAQVSGGPGGGEDRAPSRTEVSLYYTPSGPQGPGAITGSAAQATATGLEFATGRPSFNAASTGTTAASTASVRSGGGNAPSTSVPGPAPGSEAAPLRLGALGLGCVFGASGVAVLIAGGLS